MKSALEGNHFPKLAEALHENRVLWTALASDVAGEANQLPAELRARIFYLAEFTLLHTSKVLAKQASAVPLLDINAAILRGLRQAEVAK
jgi:flagellar protein FlaF